MARIMIGASAGLILRYVGLLGRSAGRYPRAALMAACTSRAAASMLRSRSNCMVTPVDPSWLDEVIWLMPAMRPNCRSSGVATEEAIVSGLAVLCCNVNDGDLRSCFSAARHAGRLIATVLDTMALRKKLWMTPRRA